MAISKQSIFRSKALEQYVQGRNKAILPRFASPPIFVFLWILLGLLIIAGTAAWFEQVPIYVAGSGVILKAENTTQQGSDGVVAVIFVPAVPSLRLRTGLPVQIQIGLTGPHLLRTIATVEPGVISPGDARKRYRLDGGLASLITQPSFVVAVQLGPTIPAHLYAGSSVSGQVLVRRERVLFLLPGFHQLIGEE